MAAARRHWERFSEARLYLTLGALVAAVVALAVVWLKEPELGGTLSSLRLGDSPTVIWPTDLLWIAAPLVAGLSIVFIIGKSPRAAMAAATSAILLGIAGAAVVGRYVGYGGSMRATGEYGFLAIWQALLLWAPAAILLIGAIWLSIVDYRALRAASREPAAPTGGPPTGVGNEGLKNWPGSTISGVDAQSNARERY
jgi:hypothetical protein